ncbi:conserved hypothetical protein [Culex quinquefasciatus]|uniref:F-box domain-containing protein n=1 Tax=Culex quinquefasciatus TaxID=7176 RepID=B0WXW9_CULQU|nr:conserved hypothetical protein [Culex quinquefasciatus]|eukprot:XP_001862241.1 conserved hypothetical protein [Culex quinquefasciatus]
MEHCKVCGLPTFTDASSVNCEGPCGNSLRTCLNCYARDSSECEPPPQKVAKLVAVEQLTLPSELWTEVFGSLSAWDLLKVRLVCHRWRKLVNGSSTLRRKLVVQFPEFIMMDRDYAPSNLPPASVVMFSRAKIARVGSWWTSFGAGVVHLTMNRCNVLLPNMLSLLKLTPNLKELHLSDILIDTLDEAPAMADFRMEQMELLHIDLNYHGQNLGVFLELCPNLKDLALLCELYSDEFKNLLQQLPSYLRKISATLESLQVIKTEHLLAELCCLDLPKLKRLHLNKCESRCKNNRALVEICRTHPTLEVLDIEDVSASNEMILHEVGALLPNLKWLAVKVPKAPGIQPSLEFTPQLRHLRLKGSTFVYPEPTFASNCPYLQELHLERVTFQEPDSLRRFLARSPNVRELRLEECKLGYWSCLLTAIRTQKQLRRLTLRYLTVEDAGRCCIDYLDNLTTLELIGFKVHQQTMVELFTMGAGSLKQLTMVGLNDTLDFEVVDVMCQKLRRLSQLTIKNCTLSNEHCKQVRERFGSVERLIIS